MTTKKWIIHSLERKTDNGFVFNVHWRYTITETDEDGKTYYADTYSVEHYEQDTESEDYIPYEELTEQDVIDWLIESFGEEKIISMDESLIKQIENQKNPITLSGLPWQSINNLNETTNENI
jgi:hypothetical protein